MDFQEPKFQTLSQGGDGGEDDSDEDIITDYLLLEPAQSLGSGVAGVPIISVTPHSPATSGTNNTGPASGSKPILDETLQHLHEIHAQVQAMRDNYYTPAASLSLGLGLGLSLTSGTAGFMRLSASCPSLNQLQDGNEASNQLGIATGHTNLSTTGDAFANGTEWLMCRVGSGSASGSDDLNQRRRSWTVADGVPGSNRQRSMSLISIDSEHDDDETYEEAQGGDSIDGRGPNRNDGRASSISTTVASATSSTATPSRSRGAQSTHSLNEADLQADFNKVAAKREREQIQMLLVRQPLQKSVSTPSIVQVDPSPPPSAANNAIQAICQQPGTATESENEEEPHHSHHHFLLKGLSSTGTGRIQELFSSNAYDAQASKRRKRGSIFFRKKKDKSKKPIIHHWESACHSTAHLCDWCNKSLAKDPALYCKICTSTVHQKCKDNIIDCNKPKISKTASRGSLVSNSGVSAISGNFKRNSEQKSGSGRSSHSPIINEERGGHVYQESNMYHHPHHHGDENYSDETPLVSSEFLDEEPITARELYPDDGGELGLADEEPDSWTPKVGKEITKKLKEKEIKRQEHIYEFVLTEKHHCLTLLVMQKVFVEGIQRHFPNFTSHIKNIFPRLAELTEIHLNFLRSLRKRQREDIQVKSIADILLQEFSGTSAERLKSAYGEFCSCHLDAVNLYKSLETDRRFNQFIQHCQTNPLLKKRGIPECILFVTQRLTKYPLLIEPLIKTSKENPSETEKLTRALALVKDILVAVDAQVAEKERRERKLEIYNRIEVKSSTYYYDNKTKFKKSDILSKDRKLRFEGMAYVTHRSKTQLLHVIVLSDVLFFLQENNNKYYFFTFTLDDNKDNNKRLGVISLQKLLVREKADDSDSLYLISQFNPVEMFVLKLQKPKETRTWINSISDAIALCQNEVATLSQEEKLKIVNVKQNQIRDIVGLLRQNDRDHARILKEKLDLQHQLLDVAGIGQNHIDVPSVLLESAPTEHVPEWSEVLTTVNEANKLVNTLYTSCGSGLSRSVSSAGEHHSDAYTSPTLPKRAETFGGFDTSGNAVNKESGVHPLKKPIPSTSNAESFESKENSLPCPKDATVSSNSSSSDQLTTPTVIAMSTDQQQAIILLSNHMYKMFNIIHQQMTSMQSLQAQLSVHEEMVRCPSGKSSVKYQPNQQLEELRNLQAQLTQKKQAFQLEMEQEYKKIAEEHLKLNKSWEQLKIEKEDVAQQREQLYRKMEKFNQAVASSPTSTFTTAVNAETSNSTPNSSTSSPTLPSNNAGHSLPRKSSGSTSNTPTAFSTSSEMKWKSSSLGKASTLPTHLLSATNQHKTSVQIKQQLPMKLASSVSSPPLPTSSPRGVATSGVQILPLRLSETSNEGRRSSTNSSNNFGYTRLVSPPDSGDSSSLMHTHTRTGSSPATMQSSGESQSAGGKPGRTNTYPKIPEKYKTNRQVEQDEKVIFF